ncbi:EAL domain-containing protein [Sideroxydans lithotrophicus]|uniref:Diguanylate cyclase/phosphodiesterase with PAS/PAC sensor(S) n=1 Tax=Sideroxydans lithotrophicus (strain ES-1) TaxID=580332 RepID=D5CNJ0_SIDLE|nr:EAL domain-containing protein [Sideroxydans lithotrophicus]ADE10903.1 diguanylate cyclase/phosphodiesterase with PAS/PAC sensor(s) [Sideroxydans lithotrophicus ES-1]
MLQINNKKELHILVWLALMLILWGLLSWYVAKQYFTHELDTQIKKEQVRAQNVSLDIADSFRRNLHFVAGISATFQRGLRFVNAAGEFGPETQASPLPKPTLIKRWTADPVLKDLNVQLKLIQSSLGIDLMFVVNSAGDCIAASNWDTSGSPIGTNFRDRKWYAESLGGTPGMQYAMGKTTHIGGLYFSSPIMIDGHFRGAVISKIDLTSLSFLTRQADAFVTDSNGVIILAHDPEMLMMAVTDAKVNRLAAQQRLELYGRTDFPELRITPWQEMADVRLRHIGNEDYPHIQAVTDLPEYGLEIHSEADLPNLPLLLNQRRSNFLLLWLLGSVTLLTVVSLTFYFRSIRQSRSAVAASEQRLRLILGSVSNGIWGLDKDGNTTFVNAAAADMLGYTPEELFDKPMHATIHHSYPDGTHYPAERCPMHATLVDGKPRMGIDEVLWRKDGSELYVDYSSHPIRSHGEMEGAVVVFEDISERRQKDEALKLASSVYQSSNDGILVTDEKNRILDVNPAFTRITGYTLEDVRGKDPGIFQSGKHDAQFYQQMWQSILDDGHWQGEIWDLKKNGELHAKWLSISVIRRADGSIYRHVGQFSDITEKKRKDELIWEQANFDTLTNLPNRRLFADRFRQAISAGARSGRYGALLSLDLDQFKRLNDTFGHSMGDKLLIEVARRLTSCVREEDTVARMGGDEFLVILNGLGSEQNEAAIRAELIAEKIRNELCRPYQLDKTEHHSSSSIGIVLFRGHSDDPERLLAHVDTAMYQSKAKGRNAICFFDSSMQEILEKRGQLETALRGALERKEFLLHYQLQMDSSGRPIGAEALLRWNNAKLGSVSPVQFIPVAEESGLILPIGHWVLETACAQLARWQSDPRFNRLCIAVNVSAIQFREAAFVAKVRNVLQQSGIQPWLLKLELTESLVLDDINDSILKMEALKNLGVKFSMDDFGTGYSSLSYLSRLPLDQLKIDQSFVRDITTTDQHDAAIVQTIISMALSLGMEVIAEGVETEEQREFLDLRGCQAYQGYLYAKPMPIEELEIKLAQLT